MGWFKAYVRQTRLSRGGSQPCEGCKGRYPHRRGGRFSGGQAEWKGEVGTAGESFPLGMMLAWSLEQRVGFREVGRMKGTFQPRAAASAKA